MALLAKEEVRRLVESVVTGEGTEEEVDGYIQRLISGVVHPRVLTVLGRGETVDQIVEELMSYKAIPLGASKAQDGEAD